MLVFLHMMLNGGIAIQGSLALSTGNCICRVFKVCLQTASPEL